MSMITQCPACQTMFRVVPDQLRLSEGWVRCGQCEQVFDANVQVVPESALAGVAEPPPDAGFAPPSHATAAAQQPPPPLMHEAPTPEDVLAEADDDLPPVDIQLDVDVPPPQREPLLVRAAEASASEHGVGLPEPVDELVVDPPAVSSPAEVGLHALSIDPEVATDQPQTDAFADALAEPEDSGIALPPVAPPAPSFMHKPMPSTSAWHRSGVRVALGLLSLVLLLLLGGQVALQERDRIAAQQPSLKPVLQAACQVLAGCSVSPYKQIDGIVIDSSSFTRLRGDAYRLSLVVKNTTPIELAAPAVELTLTDTQDKPVLRRVLSSRDFDIPAATVAAGGDWTASLAVSVKTNSGERISGYRVLAFYP